MPPKVRIKKEDIVIAGVELVREKGADALNARDVAARLHCSTQPVFSNYATMEDFKIDVVREANRLYQQYTAEKMKDSKYPPYKASGMAYIRFAGEEKELFKLLFMRDRSAEPNVEEDDFMANLYALIKESVNVPDAEVKLFHFEMWIYVHGIATMLATSYMDFEEDVISRVVTDAFQSLRERYQQGKSELQGAPPRL